MTRKNKINIWRKIEKMGYKNKCSKFEPEHCDGCEEIYNYIVREVKKDIKS